MFISKAAIICMIFLHISQTLAVNSLNSYVDSAYGGRCVIDMGSSTVLLQMGETVQLVNLPCTSIFCIGDGYGLLQSCDHVVPPDGCHYGNFLFWTEEFPKCCQRRLICDEN